jgi:hypothetical protein
MVNGIEFFTATCLNWQPLIKPDAWKDIIMGSLKFLVEQKMHNRGVAKQKIDYMYYNPVKAGLCELPEEAKTPKPICVLIQQYQ